MDNSPAKEVIYLQSYCPLTPANYKLLLLTPHNYKLFLLTPPNYKLLLLTPTNSILSQEFPNNLLYHLREMLHLQLVLFLRNIVDTVGWE